MVDALLKDRSDYKNPLKGFLLSRPCVDQRIYDCDDGAPAVVAAAAPVASAAGAAANASAPRPQPQPHPPPPLQWPTRELASTPAVVALVKCASAPATCFADRITRGDFGDSGLEDGFALGSVRPPQWKCRGCPNTDRSLLSTGSDSAIACDLCGTVDASVTLISGSRQKNCPREEDKTIVADEAARPAHELAAEAVAAGDETSQERRKRHLQSSGASRVARAVARKYDVSAAQAKVDSEVVRESRARVDGDPKVMRKRDAVLRFVTSVHQYLGSGLDERVKKHIRMEAARVVCNGYEHAKHCNDATCQIAIPSRANALIGLCTVQKCLERLICDDGASSQSRVAQRATISEIAPEVSRHELLKSLDEAKQTQAQGAGASQRAQVAAAVGLVLDWIPEQIELPCASAVDGSPLSGPVPLGHASHGSSLPPPQPPPSLSADHHHQQTALLVPPPLSLPPALQLTHSESATLVVSDDNIRSPRNGDGSPNDAIWALRNSIHSAWRLANVRADVRQAATAAVQEPELADWIRHANTLPMCVLGVAMLKAAAIKLKLDDGTDELLRQYCFQYEISPTTAEHAAVHIAAMMQVQPATTLGLFGDGIF